MRRAIDIFPLLQVMCLLSLIPVCAHGQVRYEVTAGGGFATVTQKHTATTYDARIAPNAFINLYVPLNKSVFIKSGIGFQQKSHEADYKKPDDNKNINRYAVYNTYRFISIPLQVGADIPLDDEHKFTVAGGMCYNFMFDATSKMDIDYYQRNRYISSESITVKPRIGLGSTVNTDKKDYPSLILFTPALRFDVGYVIEQRWSFNAFYEYHLQDVNVAATSARMHYIGVNAGLFLNDLFRNKKP